MEPRDRGIFGGKTLLLIPDMTGVANPHNRELAGAPASPLPPACLLITCPMLAWLMSDQKDTTTSPHPTGCMRYSVSTIASLRII